VIHLVTSFVQRCDLAYSHWDYVTKCTIAAFVHYRAVYSGTGDDVAESDLSDPRLTPFAFSCNVTNIEESLEHLYEVAPATRADDNYWARFEECTESVP